ncbi:unnamed protein product [Laminaria digitata]
MKFIAASVLVGLTSAQAFMVQPTMKTSGPSPESSSRADFAKLVTGTVAASVAVAAPALAKPGTGAKQNWFGVVGADSGLGGGMSNYFAESDTDSPYSPYSHGESGLYSTDDGAFMLKVKIDVLKDTQKRLQTVPGFIEGKKWEEIRSLLTAKAYSLRDSMNTLAADKPMAANVAKIFYRDIEQLTVYARQKNGPAALKAYNDAQTHLTKYLSLI